MIDKTPQTLGAYIRTARERAGLSQRQLATAAGFHHSRLARLESGEVSDRPKAEHLQRLADVLGLDSAELLAFIGVTPPKPRVYFRKVAGIDVSDDEAEAIIAQLRKQYRKQDDKEGDDHDNEDD